MSYRDVRGMSSDQQPPAPPLRVDAGVAEIIGVAHPADREALHDAADYDRGVTVKTDLHLDRLVGIHLQPGRRNLSNDVSLRVGDAAGCDENVVVSDILFEPHRVSSPRGNRDLAIQAYDLVQIVSHGSARNDQYREREHYPPARS